MVRYTVHDRSRFSIKASTYNRIQTLGLGYPPKPLFSFSVSQIPSAQRLEW